MANKVIRRVPRKGQKVNDLDAFVHELAQMKEIAATYRKPDGQKLTRREIENYLLTGKFPGQARQKKK